MPALGEHKTVQARVFAWGDNDVGQINVPSDVSRLNLPFTVRGSVNPDASDIYVLNYSATNAAGAVATTTRTVVVTDTTPPILTLVGASPLNLDVGTPFTDPGATAFDACEGDLTASIVSTGTVNTAAPGSYTLNYTVTDSNGNPATTNRTVLVRDAPAWVSPRFSPALMPSLVRRSFSSSPT